MTFELAEVVPWGRSFDEYVAMFALSAEDLSLPILGCGDGPASFNATLRRRGGTVVSIDPLYAFSGDEIRERIREVTPAVLEQARRHADDFVWERIRSIEELKALRLAAMEEFLADYEAGRKGPPYDVAQAGHEAPPCDVQHDNVGRPFTGRQPAAGYQAGALPLLPYADGEFGLALCSHLLFLYSEQHSLRFHIDSVVELCRVAAETRIFPLLELGGAESRHLRPLMEELRPRGFYADVRCVPYEFQRGGNQMLVVRKPSPVILHIATDAAWQSAIRRSAYQADSLETEGFIHCSDPRQVLWVANTRFRHRQDLVLLRIAVSTLEVPVRYENLEGGSDLFPHVYGPLNINAIVRATPFRPNADGGFEPEHLADLSDAAARGTE